MKTIKTLAIALAATLFGFTAVNAQTQAGTNGTDAVNVDSIQADFVTVGATMPYITSVGTTVLDAWKTQAKAAGFSTAAIEGITVANKWKVGETELAATGDAVQILWSTEGAYSVTVSSTFGSCSAAVSGKPVYVLPEPNVTFDGANFEILGCDVASKVLDFKVTGLGEKNVAYSVTKELIHDAGTPAVQTPLAEGTALTAPTTYFNQDVTNYAKALSDFNAGTEGTITVNSLEPGYLYTVTITNVDDQISRKSGITPTVTYPTYQFTVVPVPATTKINHVANVE
ncbi:MAG: hypothetical protein LBU91_02075 [Bacteroidales bacterium]|jgi:hypothetical protein|nr:hypothetical protein [Bacteroidales bacterium]